LNLQDAVKQHYGDNYTRVSTDKLIKLVEAYDKPTKKAPAPKKEEAPKPEAKKPAEEPAEKSSMEKIATAEVGSAYEAACLVFLVYSRITDCLMICSRSFNHIAGGGMHISSLLLVFHSERKVKRNDI
jgi:hypothetical protein